MIVLDASAVVELLLHTAAGRRVALDIADPAADLHAPHLLDLEVASAPRRYEAAGVVSTSLTLDARIARSNARGARVRVPWGPWLSSDRTF